MNVKKRTTKPSQVGPERIIITDEKTAWEVLERALTVGMKGDVDLRFDGWPVFHVNVKGKDWHSSVPTRVMAPLLDVQREINRAYASIRYGTSNSRRLKHDERDELEVVVKVTEGSSSYDAELWKHFSAMAEAAVGRMSGTEIVVTVVTIAAIVGGIAWGKAWLAQRRQEKELDHKLQVSQEDTHRLELVVQALTRQPSLALV